MRTAVTRSSTSAAAAVVGKPSRRCVRGATLKAYGGRHRSSALAQEKSGEFCVDARMLGGYVRADIEHAEVSVFIGKNPYQSHGFPRARAVLKEIARDRPYDDRCWACWRISASR
jgi:hypothetical protein